MIFDFLNHFVPQSAKQNPLAHLSSYVLAGMLLANAFAIFWVLVFILTVFNLPEDTHWIAVGFTAGGLVFYSLMLFIYIKTSIYQFVANAMLVFLLIQIYTGVHVSGGFIDSPIVQILMLVPITAFLLLDLTWGVRWLLVVLCMSLVSLVLSLKEIGYVNLLGVEHSRIMNAGLHFVLFFMLGTATVLYEFINNLLKKRLFEDGEKFKHLANFAVESSIVNESADSLAESGQKLLEAAVHQKASVEELSTTTEELTATAEQNSHLATTARDSIHNTEEYIADSKNELVKLVDSMGMVKESSEEIQTINNLINEISYQTNILSLNAMIEASRSGDSGGGFKVVALEVKKLAERSATAADTISKLLVKNLDSVSEGVNFSESIQHRFMEISDKFVPLSSAIQNISDASFEQKEALRHIMEGLHEINQIVEKNMALAEGSSENSRKLRENASKLTKVVKALEAKSSI